VTHSRENRDDPTKRPVRAGGPVEGVGGSREVPSAEASGPNLEQRLQELERERDEYLNDLKRVAADFENYRKRAARDQESRAAQAAASLVKELIPIMDDLERALEAASSHEEAKLEEGVQLIHRSLVQLLQRQGLEEIATEGRFDPHVHEALLSQPSDREEGTVLDVLQKGYRLGDRVLRPARVVVAGARAEEGAPGGDADG